MNFIKLYDSYFDDVYRYIFFKVGNRWDTDDLAAEVFKKAYEKFRMQKGDNPKAWLFSIARNTVTDYYRRKKAVVMSDEEMDLYTYSGFMELDLEKKAEICELRDIITKLPKEDIELINLRYFSDMKVQDIAKLFGKSEDAMKMKFSRLIRKIRESVKENMEELL